MQDVIDSTALQKV